MTVLCVLWATLSTVASILACSGFYLPYWIQGRLLGKADAYFSSFRRCNYPRIRAPNATPEIVYECARYSSPYRYIYVYVCGTFVYTRAAHLPAFPRPEPHPSRLARPEIPECITTVPARKWQISSAPFFWDIPSAWWQASTVTMGIGVSIAVIGALTLLAAASSFLPHILRTPKHTRLLGSIHFIAAILCLYVIAAMICGGLVMYPIGWDNQEVRESCGKAANVYNLETSPAAKQKFIGQREDRFRVDDDLSTVCTFQANAHCPGPAISSSVR
ncbi:LHFPL tetraspan subfamily member 6 protein-like isoform X3 [Vespula maculifrons]|uniref:LHFPL tetraspan subfamily member 6 protein-like isoform X3 n=1 Tax=Vespula maculifrons TaxID=7453 RepID=A0ABD2BMT5_VESMC